MTLRYETGIATFIQFILASLFILVTQIGSSVVTCFKDSANCVGNLFPSIIFFILIAVIFGVIWLIGFAAQDRRSKRLAQLLILIEGAFALLALLSIKLNASSRSLLGLIGSFSMLVLSVWIISLAGRLRRAGQGRVVGRRRPTIDQ